MKPITTLLLTLLCVSTISAQRSVDLKVEFTMLGDTSMVQNNRTINMNSIVTHLGGDTIKVGDTIKLSLYANGMMFPFDNGTTVDSYLYYSQKVLTTGDTMQVNFPPVFVIFPTQWWNFCMKIDVTNASDTLIDTLQTNNTTCTKLLVVPTSVVNLHTEQNITVYPNPATNMLHIQGLKDTDRATIYNALGKAVLHTQIIDNSINITSLPSGNYYLDIGSTRTNFIKQ